MTEINNDYIAVRVTPSLKKQFVEKASQFGDRSEVHRELIRAFVQDRLIIKPSTEQKFDKLYKEHE